MRGILKTFGHVLPKKLRATNIASLCDIVQGNATLEPIVMPMLKTPAATMEQLQVYDRAVHRIAREDETARHPMAAPRVGMIVALVYMTGIETPARLARSPSVGAYFGMTPRRYQSGEVDQAGRISKCGDGMVRGLLYEAAKVLLSRSARSSDVQVRGPRARETDRQEEGDHGCCSQTCRDPAPLADDGRAILLHCAYCSGHCLIASNRSQLHCHSL